MTTRMRTIGSLALAGALTLGGAACGSSGSSASFCDQAKSAQVSNVKPTDGKSFTDALTKIESSAPSEIKGDIKTLVDYLTALQKDPTKTPSTATQAQVETASKNIQTYLKDTCGITTSS